MRPRLHRAATASPHARPTLIARAGRAAGLAVALALLLALPARTAAQSSDAVAKARFAVALARFVQWPAGSEGAPLRLCVLQDSRALAQAFEAQDGLAIGARSLSVRLHPLGPGDCDLLFVDASGAQAAAGWLRGSAPVLTLGAVDGFLAQGGMVELVNVNDTLRFDVNLKAIRMARLGLSSQVLKLARQVRE